MPSGLIEWHVYILECVTESGRVTVHVGVAKDPAKRLQDHRYGRVKATRGRAVRILGHSMPMGQGDALAVEAMLKKESPERKREVASNWSGGLTVAGRVRR